MRDIWQTPNQLLKAVLADLLPLQYIAGYKTLGSINQVVTGPLWRVLESKDVTILDMNKRFRRLLSHFKDWSFDPSSVISGEAFIFDDFPPFKNNIYTVYLWRATMMTQFVRYLRCCSVHFIATWNIITYLKGSMIIILITFQKKPLLFQKQTL